MALIRAVLITDHGGSLTVSEKSLHRRGQASALVVRDGFRRQVAYFVVSGVMAGLLCAMFGMCLSV
jgi:hypothetical protein